MSTVSFKMKSIDTAFIAVRDVLRESRPRPRCKK
jgi:hypothetical protein